MVSQKLQKIKWGIPATWINSFPLYFGKHAGFFSERGIDLEIKLIHGGPELSSAIKAKEILIGNMGSLPFSTAFAGGLPAKIIGSSITQQLDIYLVARPEIKTIAELRGKKIGVLSLGSCDDFFNRFILEKEGIDPTTDVEVIPLTTSYGDPACISSGKVDATYYVEPQVTPGEQEGVFRVLTRVGDYYPQYQWGIIFAHEEYIAKNRKMIRSLLEAYRKSSRYIVDNPDKCIDFGCELYDLSRDIFSKVLERSLGTWELENRIDQKGLDNVLSIQQEMGVIGKDIKQVDMVSDFVCGDNTP